MFGVFINHGSFTQILTGIIDLFFDSILYFQFFYYRYIYRKCSRKSKMNQFFNSIDSNVDKKDPARFSETTPSNSALLMNVLMMGGSAFNWAEPYQGKQIAGTVFGWVGSCIYIGSRIPQAIQNFKQKQVKDLSLAFVILMCVSNLSYILSVLFKSNNLVYLWMQVPYLVGAFGPMFLDLVSITQYFVYSKNKKTDLVIVDGVELNGKNYTEKMRQKENLISENNEY
ncbi:hypothetical protein TRFO_14867 [Tritrichomonas foetus]|uniref:PQ loop repeat family protein n=1 Tax=Tritrichomonas foetus TaxID=1144522 RepID=A0A1J4KUY4_9EUKA|nr:hypothetical protein TRFO_14867 [Tritrichomonas foetus]|eukprot:OHT14688.1 hypothetical protein TRFO_14867 [Tritrichomonas foetus]